MRITPIVLLALLISCSKKDIGPATTTAAPAPGARRTLEACSFGLTHFNLAKRPENTEVYAGKPKPPRSGEAPVSINDAVILLDFDGETVSNTVWNTANAPISCAGANLQATEMDKVLARVSEDYAPFNVTVTTDEADYLAANPARRIRVVVTESWEWYGQVGGIAYYNSFTWGDNTPCFVFSTLLGYNEKYIAEAISHEVGHTLGLYHQAVYGSSCDFISEYNEGRGSGELGWAPIMGIGYYRNVTTWTKGKTVNGCSATQDDVAQLTAILGTKPDLNNSMNKSEELLTSVDGLINAEGDTDYYYFDQDQKAAARLTVEPYCIGNGVGANMQMAVKIYDKQGNLLRTESSAGSLAVTTSLAKGKYYVGVETVANANQSRYGMLGRYRVRVN